MQVGTKLGPYEILAKIGEGGMGQVWKAIDTRLGRVVAIKTSHEHFSDRVDREARAIAALNHPHICQLYDTGPDYLVMEYIEGKQLEGPLPLNLAVTYAIQICDALDAAHRKGISHLDLKPANILLTKSGVKLLDFGLAKLQPSAPFDGGTMTRAITARGHIAGTLQYMAPEQLQGKETDTRSDLFSFGAVFYEMLTGKRAFDGDNAASVISAVMKDEPPLLSSILPLTPHSIDRIVKRCLAKDPDRRWQNARDLMLELEALSVDSPIAVAARTRPWHWLAAAVLGLTSAALAVALWLKPDLEQPVSKVSLMAPEKISAVATAAISPDGRHIAFIGLEGGRSHIWIRSLDSLTAQELPGTQRSMGGLTWSPDSRWIAFSAEGKLKKVDIHGGPPQVICNAVFSPAASWSQQGVILFNQDPNGIASVPASGGTPTPVVSAAGERFRFPYFLPDGRHFLYVSVADTVSQSTVWVGTLDSAERTKLTTAETNVAFAAGHLLFIREGTLLAQPFDAGSRTLSGEPLPFAEPIAMQPSAAGAGNSTFSVSSNGVLAFASPPAARQTALTWFSRDGEAGDTVQTLSGTVQVDLSPDGKRAAVDIGERGGDKDIWIADLVRGGLTRFTFDRKFSATATWSPDGERIVYARGEDGPPKPFVKSSSGVGTGEAILKDVTSPTVPSDWSSDGKYVLYSPQNSSANSKSDLYIVEIDTADRKPVPVLATEFNETQGKFSPDGKWIAYQSDESGRNQIYVMPFTPGRPASGKSQVSLNGGAAPRWRRDGKEIYYIEANRKLLAVDTKLGAKFQAGKPANLFEANFGGGGRYFPYDAAADGQRFLVLNLLPEPAAAKPITVILNWPAALKH